MSRRPLVLYRLDRPALKAFSAELEAGLLANDVAALALQLGVPEARLSAHAELVEAFLLPDDGSAADLFAALRRAARQRALHPAFTSDSLALEGRLRAFDRLREDPVASAAIDRLLEPSRLPWYLRTTGASCGWLDGSQRAALAERCERLKGVLPPELRAFGEALASVEGDVILHDRL